MVGRLAHVAFAWSYYSDRPLDIPQVWLGGFSGPGALAGGLLTLVMLAVSTRQNLGSLADAYLPLAAAVVVSAWLACWVDGAAYGVETRAWWGIPGQDEWGDVARRAPLQVAAACLSLGIFWYADRRRDVKRPGQGASLALLGLGLLIFLAAIWRADPSPAWVGLRPEAWAGLGITLLGGSAFLVTRFNRLVSGRRVPAAETDVLQNTS